MKIHKTEQIEENKEIFLGMDKDSLRQFIIMIIVLLFFVVIFIAIGYYFAYNEATQHANEFLREQCYDQWGHKFL